MTTLEEAAVWIEKQEFVYAKTYAASFPHYYTTRNRCDEFEFEQFIRLIREYGVVKGFLKKQYVYLELNGYEYWEVGRPLKCVQVLNKCKIDDNAYFRKIEPTEEEKIELKAKLIMRDCYISSLLNKQTLSKQEAKHLDFLMNTTRRIHGGGRNIIDHSKIKVRYE